MKSCPVCQAAVFDDMDRCYVCLHDFGVEAGRARSAQGFGEVKATGGGVVRERRLVGDVALREGRPTGDVAPREGRLVGDVALHGEWDEDDDAVGSKVSRAMHAARAAHAASMGDGRRRRPFDSGRMSVLEGEGMLRIELPIEAIVSHVSAGADGCRPAAARCVR